MQVVENKYAWDNILESPAVDNLYEEHKTKYFRNIKSVGTIAEKLAQRNCKNKIGYVDYNERGEECFPLERVSEIFCDNFILHMEVDAKNMVGKNKSTKCRVNNMLRNKVLQEAGLSKISVKAVQLTEDGDEKEDGKTGIQTYKVECSDEDPITVLEVVNAVVENEPFGIMFGDIDVTVDYARSFFKQKLIDHLELLIEAGEEIRIVDNDKTVGQNCLSFLMTKCGDITFRSKYYNKFAQNLESGSVRSIIGSHLYDWCDQPRERLRKTIPKTIDRGFTRFEFTFYNYVPTMEEIEEHLNLMESYIPEVVCYKTPIKY